MKLRHFAIMAIAAIAVTAGAAWFVVQQRSERSIAAGPLYPSLLDKVNQIDRLTIRSASEGEAVLVRNGQNWSLENRFNYPADFDKIRETLLQLANLEAVSPRTRLEKNYPELGVENVSAESASGVRLTAQAGDDVVADLIVGRTRPAEEGGGVFVRKADAEQSWLANGSFEPPRRPVHWLNRVIVDVDERRIAEARVDHDEGGDFTLVKTDSADETVTLATPAPEGRMAKPHDGLRPILAIPDFLILDDVAPADRVDFSDPKTTASFHTWDGLNLTVEVATDEEGNVWTRWHAAQGEADPAYDEMLPRQDEDSEAGRIADQLMELEDIQAEIELINTRTSPWVYRLTSYKTGKLQETLRDVTQTPGSADAPRPDAGEPASDDDAQQRPPAEMTPAPGTGP